MAQRPYWRGTVRVSLVSFTVEIYPAISGTEHIHLNQLHKDCGQRIRQPPTCPVHGKVARVDIVKGYEFASDRYVIVEASEIAAIKLRSEKTIEITGFVPDDTVDEVFLDSTYYMTPAGNLAQEPFQVIQAAMAKTRVAGLGLFTHAGHERPVLLRPKGRGFTLTTLHSGAEVRPANQYFEDLAAGAPKGEHLKLAETLIKGMASKFEPASFKDRYQEALRLLVESKVKGEKPVIVQEQEITPHIDFIAALKESLGRHVTPNVTRVRPGMRKPAAKSVRGNQSQKRKKA